MPTPSICLKMPMLTTIQARSLSEMNLHSRSVAAPSGFRQTSRIALGKRTCLDEALECQIMARRNCFARSALEGDFALLFSEVFNMRTPRAAKLRDLLWAICRITAGGGPQRFWGHDQAAPSDASRSISDSGTRVRPAILMSLIFP